MSKFFTSRKIFDNVTQIGGLGGELCYLIEGSEKALLIDGLTGVGSLKAFVRECTDLPVTLVLTHGHVDHIGAVASLRGPDVPVAIHAADAAMLTHPNLSLSVMFGGAPSQGEADLLLEEGDLLLAGVPFSVLHTPGHTPGGICLRCGDDLFTGDTLFCRGYGRTDLPGGDEQALMRSLRRLLALEEGVRVHPGHGPSTTIGRERRVYGLP